MSNSTYNRGDQTFNNYMISFHFGDAFIKFVIIAISLLSKHAVRNQWSCTDNIDGAGRGGGDGSVPQSCIRSVCPCRCLDGRLALLPLYEWLTGLRAVAFLFLAIDNLSGPSSCSTISIILNRSAGNENPTKPMEYQTILAIYVYHVSGYGEAYFIRGSSGD